MPITIAEFLNRLEHSGILDAAQLAVVRKKSEQAGDDAQAFVKQLHKAGDLTGYQAQALWKNKGPELAFGNYVVEDELGRGGMGVVLKARHTRMQRRVAIKVLPAKLTADADAIARFQREVVAAAQLNHTNIVGAFDADEFDGRHVLVMEFVDGRDLSSVVKKQGRLSLKQAIECVIQAARGLEFAHKRGVIHRDIKPANLLLDAEGVVKILDMGLARFSDAADVGTQAELTGTGTIMGTVDYMSPEQAMSTKNADARSDIYSLGMTLYYLLTGNPAYTGDTLMARLMAHANEPIPSLQDERPEVGDRLQAVFAKMAAKQPGDRYQTMTVVLADLEACQTEPSGTAVVASAPVTGNESSGGLTGVLDAPSHPDNAVTTDFEKKSSVATKKRKRRDRTQTAVDEATLISTTDAETSPTLQSVSSKRTLLTPKSMWTDRRVLGGVGAVAALVIAAAVFISGSFTGTPPSEIKRVDDVGNTVESPNIEGEFESGPAELNYALEFDGVDDRVELPFFELDREAPQTIECWFTASKGEKEGAADPEGRTDSLLVVSGIDSGRALILDRPKDALFTNLWDAQTGHAVYYSFKSAKRSDLYDVRHHAAAVWDGQQLHLYVNGVRRQSGAYTSGPEPESKPPQTPVSHIGAAVAYDGESLSRFFSGEVDECRVSNVARYDKDFTPQDPFEPDEHTVALYHFDEGSGSVLKDSSGNGHDGKIVGAEWVPADAPTVKPRYALVFDGVDDRVELPSLGDELPDEVTLEAWVDVPREPEGWWMVADVLFGQDTVAIAHAENLFVGSALDWSESVASRYAAAPPAKRVHVAVVVTPDRETLYLAGKVVTGTKERAPVPPTPERLHPGSLGALPFKDARGYRPGEWAQFFAGTLDEIRVSNVACYRENFEPAQRHEPDEHTLALYHCDEGEGEVLQDSSGNGHHGKIVGAKWVRMDEATTVDLLSLVDPQRDGVVGKWSKPGELVGEVDGDDAAFWLQVPYVPPDEYDLNLVVDPGERGALIVGLVTPHGRFRVAVDRYFDLQTGARHTTFGDVDNPAAEWKGRLLKPGEKNDVRFELRRNGLRIVCNGQQVADWQGDLGAPEFRDIGLYQTPNERCIVVGSVFDPLHIHAIELVPVTGTGKVPAWGKLLKTDNHGGGVWCVDISADGRFAVSGGGGVYVNQSYDFRQGRDYDIHVWDTRGDDVRRLSGHSGIVRTVVLSADARFLLSSSWDESIRLWDLDEGKVLQEFNGHTQAVAAADFVPDTDQIVSVAPDGTLRVWDRNTGENRHTFALGLEELHIWPSLRTSGSCTVEQRTNRCRSSSWPTVKSSGTWPGKTG